MSGLVYNDTVFNVIGDYPVVDQFDVSYTGLLTGSMNDRYITGSLFTTYKAGVGLNPGDNPFKDITTFGKREKAFSKLGKINTVNFTPGNNTSYELQPWKERAGFVRTTRIFSRSERYKDSLPPNYGSLISRLGGTISLNNVPLGTAAISIGLSGSALYDTALGFHETFPLSITASPFGDNPIAKSKKVLSTFGNQPIYIFEEGKNNALVWLNSFSPTTNVLSNDIEKIFFGFGDRNKIFEISPGVNISQKSLPSYREIMPPGMGVYSRAVGPIIRGWKYGLISASPYFTSAVFRRDRFGQNRDMLEQRPSTATIRDTEYSPVNYFGDVETAAFTSYPPADDKIENEEDPETFSVVNVNFCKLGIKPIPIVGESKLILTYVKLSPTETSSSNLSTFVTSSLPFFDV